MKSLIGAAAIAMLAFSTAHAAEVSQTGLITAGMLTTSSNATSVFVGGVWLGVQAGDQNGASLVDSLNHAYMNLKNVTIFYDNATAQFGPCNVVFNPTNECFHIQSVHFNN